jgi:putative addiction module component (TIGR02574 family)
MGSEVQNIAERALRLPPSARAYIAETLLESLDIEEDFPISDAWMAEVRQRCREIDSGVVKPVSGQKAMERLRDKYS